MLPRSLSALTLAVCALAVPATATAQVSRVGDTTTLIAALARGSAVAYDSRNDRYLVVSSHGVLWGRLVDGSGAPIGGQFQIGGAVHAHFPRVAFSPDADGGQGGFLVVWHESDTSPTSIHARMVSSAGALLTGDTMIEPSTSFWEVGAAVSYSTVSREFLVAWRTFSPATIRGIRIGNGGTALSASFPIAAYHEYADNPNIAYNPSADEWMVVHSGWQGSAYVSAQRVKPGTGALIGGPNPFGHASAVYITDVAYNPATGQYLAAWHTGIMLGQVLSAAGQPLGSVIPLSSRYQAYDALSLARNPLSGTYFAVSHDSSGTQDGGVEINQNGQPLTSGVQVTSIGGTGNFYPRLATSTIRPDWYVSAANVFTSTIGQRITTATTGGGSNGPPPGPPPSCTFALSSPSATVAAGAGGGGFVLHSNASGCAWTASSTAGWLTPGLTSGSGPASINFSVASNLGAPRSAAITVAGQTYAVLQLGRESAGVHDLTGDGLSDLLWFNAATRQAAVWAVSGATVIVTGMINNGTPVPAGWTPVGTGDLNADGFSDIVWRHADGTLAAWLMRGVSTILEARTLSIGGTTAVQSDPAWEVVGVGDLNGDGAADLVWQHANGSLAAWMMQAFTVTQASLLSIGALSDTNWHIVGAGDIDGDGKADLIFQHPAGWMGAWLMNGFQVRATSLLSMHVTSDPLWSALGVGDVNGDGRADILWQHAYGGVAVWHLSGFTVSSGQYLSIPALADLNWKMMGPG